MRIFHLYLEMYSKCTCKQANVFSILFSPVLDYAHSILLSKLLIWEEKKMACVFTYYSFYYLIQFIVDFGRYMSSNDILTEPPLKIQTQSCMEERWNVFSVLHIFTNAYFLLCCAVSILLLVLQVLVTQNKKCRWFKSLCIQCFTLWLLTPVFIGQIRSTRTLQRPN